MPNWCQNTVMFDFSEALDRDAEKMREFLKGSGEDKVGLLQVFYPMPDDLNITSGWFGDAIKQADSEAKQVSNLASYGYKDWYDWRIANWGTKWDVNRLDVVLNGCYRDDKQVDMNEATKFEVSFDTAWAPPSEFLQWVYENLKIESSSAYLENGMGFCGIDQNGFEDEYYRDYSELKSKNVGEILRPMLDCELAMQADMTADEMEADEIMKGDTDETNLETDSGNENDQRTD